MQDMKSIWAIEDTLPDFDAIEGDIDYLAKSKPWILQQHHVPFV